MRIETVNVRGDNYAYLLIDEKAKKAVSFDIFDVPKVLTRVPNGVELIAAITTHHHEDHSGGNKAFLAKYPDLHIYGGFESSRDDPKHTPNDGAIDIETPNQKGGFIGSSPYTRFIKDGSTFKVGSIDVSCIHTPCHTQDSICFLAKDSSDPSAPPAVFTGDTLFISGCGRFFEGDGAQMYSSLNKLAKLPDETIVLPGHEYTADNVKFALAVDPGNQDVARLKKIVDSAPTIDGRKVAAGKTTIGDEKLWNMFMRLDTPAVREATEKDETAPVSEVMDVVRELKNSGYKGKQ